MNDQRSPVRRLHAPPAGAVQRGLAQLIAGLILLQAVLAGRHLFSAWTITLHGVVGNTTFALALGLVAVTASRRTDRAAILAATLLALALTAQVGLGYSGRTSAGAAAWHIPNGVLSFGFAVYLASHRARMPDPATAR